MKKAFAVFCALILMPSLNAHAWVGGPWSNNQATATGDDGIYEAVATMTNGTGMYRWAVRNLSKGGEATATGADSLTAAPGNVLFGAGTLGTFSSNVWYYNGIVYYGRAFGTVNSAIGIVSVIGNATTLSTNAGDPNINNQQITETSVTNNGIDVQTVASNQNVLVTVSPQLYPATANSSFTAKLRNSGVDAPAKRFSGTGVISFSRNPNSIRLVAFGIDAAGIDVTIDGSTTSGTAVDDFEQQGHVQKFKVMGSQVSTQVFP